MEYKTVHMSPDAKARREELARLTHRSMASVCDILTMADLDVVLELEARRVLGEQPAASTGRRRVGAGGRR